MKRRLEQQWTWNSSVPASSAPDGVVRRLPTAAQTAPMPTSDAESLVPALVARARTGDVAAWSRLYQEFFDRVFRHVCYLTGDPGLSEDLVQDVFARAMVSVHGFDGQSSFIAWLRGIAINVVRMHWRRTRNTETFRTRLEAIEIAREQSERSPHDLHLRDQKMKVLYQILATLPEGLREAFVLRELEGISTQEASVQLGISPGNVAVRASRARARIREELERLGWVGGGR